MYGTPLSSLHGESFQNVSMVHQATKPQLANELILRQDTFGCN